MSQKTDDLTEINTDTLSEDHSTIITAAQKEYWIDTAEENLQTAKAMLDTKRYLWLGYMCHLVAEKALKSIIAKNTNEFPPKIHKLIDLAKQGGIFTELSSEQIKFLASLMPFQIEARYPSHKKEVYNALNFDNCKDIFIKTEEFLLWIKKKLLF
ncbi:MAG: HEPN domain-containing protein [Deltaproteobacteria bacterium]|jgi:HEPN domain-containing protein|nr:HEPN domain-containing protein [Deltaproteobacteria bacterium]